MKRVLCLLLALMMLLTLSVQAFADEDILYCRICGKQIPTDSKVCPYCGEKVIRIEDGSDKADQNTKTDENAQSTGSSPATQTAAVPTPGPFNTVIGGENKPGRVYVTKSPTSESVPYGGSCMFIAHAANAASVTWYIANSDLSLITTAAEAPSRVAGLSVSGVNSDTLVLYGIPSWMNGCQVQACFTGEGGPVYTEIARIWTYEPEPEPSYNKWSFWDWVNYYYYLDTLENMNAVEITDSYLPADSDTDIQPAEGAVKTDINDSFVLADGETDVKPVEADVKVR